MKMHYASSNDCVIFSHVISTEIPLNKVRSAEVRVVTIVTEEISFHFLLLHLLFYYL